LRIDTVGVGSVDGRSGGRDFAVKSKLRGFARARGGAAMVMRKVGKYEVGRTIGEGTFAKVKFAQNTETGESVAMKVLDRQTVVRHKMVEQVGFRVWKCLSIVRWDDVARTDFWFRNYWRLQEVECKTRASFFCCICGSVSDGNKNSQFALQFAQFVNLDWGSATS